MKKLLLILLLSPLSLLAQTSTQYQHIKLTWTPPSGTFVACSSTVKTSCINSYVETLTDPTGASNTVLPAWGVSSYIWTPGGFLLCGTWNISILIDYLNETGVDTKTAAASTTAVVSCPFVVSPPSAPNAAPAP